MRACGTGLFFIAVLYAAEKRVLADAAAMDDMVQLQRNNESGGKRGDRRVSTINGQEGEEAQALWVLSCADDDAGIVSRLPGGLEERR